MFEEENKGFYRKDEGFPVGFVIQRSIMRNYRIGRLFARWMCEKA